MKFTEFARVIILSGLAAAVAAAQQPPPARQPAPAAAQPPAPASPRQAPSLAPATAAAESAVAPDAVVLSIGDQKFTRAQFEELLAALAQNGRPATTAAQKRQVAEQFSELETLAQAARKRKLDENPGVKQMMTIQSDSYLVNTLAKQVTEEAKLTEPEMRSYYDAHKSEYEEARASHILIRFKGSQVPLKPSEKDLTEEEALAKAQDIRKQLAAGADFATLAKAESDDPGSGEKGGALGTFKHGQMVAPFDQAAFSLPVGQISEPVKTQFGYHIIKVEARTSKNYEEAKPDIEKELKPKMAREALDKLKQQTPVTLNESYFGK